MLAFDTETALIRPGRAAPELACVSFSADNGQDDIMHWQDPDLLPWLEEIFDTEDCIIGHNVAFDTAVLAAQFPSLLPHIFKAYDESRITDTLLRQQLLDIADGSFRGWLSSDGTWHKPKYGLADLARRYHLQDLDKDTWRLQYGQLREIPLDQWPVGARQYSILDAVTTLQVHQLQTAVPDEFEQARDFFALQLASVWGLKTSKEGVDALRRETQGEIDIVQQRLIGIGLVRKDGTRDTKAAQRLIKTAWLRQGLEGKACTCDKATMPPPKSKLKNCQSCNLPLAPIFRTKAGSFALDEDACESCDDPKLEDYTAYTSLIKVRDTDCEMLAQGVELPIHTRFKMVETTRVASSKPNVMNITRSRPGKLGVRECFVPRDGWCFLDADFPGLELRTLAETCYTWLGHSNLGDALNDGLDPHTVVGAQIAGISYEEGIRRYDALDETFVDDRGAGKVGNFGLPGGLGVDTFVDYAFKAYGVRLTLDRAKEVKESWQQAWPEMVPYHKLIKSKKDYETGYYIIEHVGSGIVRACSAFTKAANSPFQSLGASCAKRGMYYVTKTAYSDTKSPLFGARPVNFVHDQVIAEVPYLQWGPDRTDAAAKEFARLFAAGAQSYLKFVKISCKPVLMMNWSKKAKQVHDEKGRLIPWK